MNLQIINAVWGKKYIDTFLQLSLPTQFSLGNLKELKSKPNFILYTDQAGKEQILNAPIYKKLNEPKISFQSMIAKRLRIYT